MNALMNKKVLEALEHRIQTTHRVLLFVDYDSVLVPQAHLGLTSEQRENLRELSEKTILTLVITSNHSLTDLKKMMGFSGIYLIANNGLEIFGPDLNVVHTESKKRRKELSLIYERLTKALHHLPGIHLENRDLSLAISISVANTKVQNETHRILEEIWTPIMDTFTLREFREEWILYPRIGWGKNRAVMFIWNKFSSSRHRPLVIFLSANENDEEIFTLMGKEGIGIVFGGTARIQTSKADYFLKNHSELNKFILWLIHHLAPSHSHTVSK